MRCLFCGAELVLIKSVGLDYAGPWLRARDREMPRAGVTEQGTAFNEEAR